MQKRFIITGSMRSGSKWLASMFQNNVVAPHVDVRHEAFSHDFPAEIVRWQAGPDGVYGSVGHDHIAMPILHRALNPTWVFIWRDPLETVLSMLGAWRKSARMPQAGEIAHRMFDVFAVWNTSLMLAEQLSIEPTHWYFDWYIKPKGFRALAASLDLELKDELVEPTIVEFNMTPESRKVYPEDCPRLLLDYVSELMEYFPRVKHALELARTVKEA
jgi:hypothetical protein